MCDYCNCRSLAPIADLSADHAALEALAAKVRDDAAGSAAKRAAFAELVALLRAHTDKEERGLFAELRAEDSMVEHVERLLEDHDAIWHAIAHVEAFDGDDVEWQRCVEAVLGALAAHVWVEEYDIFPASVVGLSSEAWEKLTAGIVPAA